MAQAYVPIQTVTVGSGGTSTIEFTNIPQNYTDLKMVISGRTNEAGQSRSYVRYRFNGSSSAIYSYKWLFAYDNNVIVSNSDSSLTSGHIIITPAANATASTFSNIEMYIPNYTGSSNKSLYIDGVSENNSSSIYMLSLCAPIWASSSAITSITLYAVSVGAAEKFVEFTTVTLYGIGGARASGGTITADAKYTYHTFTSTGTFTALEKIKGAEVLLVAGGGGGGSGDNANQGGGGGGGGGVIYATNQLLTAGTSYSAVVGSGGSGGSFSSGNGNNGSVGSNSSFGRLSAYGGGFGGTVASAGGNGGSGGGAGAGLSQSGGTASAGTTTLATGYANAGGNNTGFTGAGGGGGGSGVAGSVAASNTGGKGGDGTTLFSAWGYATSTGESSGGMYYYAGGGGGAGYSSVGNGAKGLGGATAGANGGSASNATANTGGGGGGASGTTSRTGGTGGSGLVIIRYPN